MSILIIIAIVIAATLAISVLIYILAALIAQCTIYPPCKDHRDVTKSNIIVTGGTSGIGKETVIDLFLNGATVIFTGRKADAAKEIIREIEKRAKSKLQKVNKTSSALLEERIKSLDTGKWEETTKEVKFLSKFLIYYKLDQASLKACKTFCDWFKSEFDSLDTLHLNAGLLFKNYKETDEGFEYVMGVNHYSHYLIAHELLPLIKRPRSRESSQPPQTATTATPQALTPKSTSTMSTLGSTLRSIMIGSSTATASSPTHFSQGL